MPIDPLLEDHADTTGRKDGMVATLLSLLMIALLAAAAAVGWHLASRYVPAT